MSQLKKKITTTEIQKILNHFFFLFIFPRPGGWIWTKEAGAKLEVVNCEDGDENPAKDTGPETDGIENGDDIDENGADDIGDYIENDLVWILYWPVGDGRPNVFCGNTGYPYLLYLARN